ncbi:13934_t:CDS:2, partial [Gigaspora rosea]
PEFLYQSEYLRSNVCKSSSEAITSVYQLAFSTKTKFNGLLVMGFDNSEICNLLLSDIYFRPFSFKISNLNLVISEIGISNNPNWNYAGKGYKSSFVYNFQKIQSLFLQEFTNNEAVVKFEFWTRSEDSAKDRAILKYLYECEFLQSTPNYENPTDQFWSAFQNALD